MPNECIRLECYVTPFFSLAESDWMGTGITLCAVADANVPSVEDFKKHFPVVFIDVTGRLNLCAHMTTSTYERVRYADS